MDLKPEVTSRIEATKDEVIAAAGFSGAVTNSIETAIFCYSPPPPARP